MDISNNNTIDSDSNKTNSVTLKYLTNPSYLLNKSNNLKLSKIENKSSESKFYRKRILAITKDLFKKEKRTNIENNIVDAFNEYCAILVQHFKMIDTKDILQDEYGNMDLNSGTDADSVHDAISDDLETINKVNAIMMKKIEKPVTLDNFVKKHSAPVDETPVPQLKQINLTEPELRNKGVKKSNNKYKI